MPTETVQALCRVTALLYIHGQTTHRLVRDTARLAQAWGLDWQVMPQWDGVLCCWRRRDVADDGWQSLLLPIRPSGVDMHKVARTNRWIDQVCDDARCREPERLRQSLQALGEVEQLAPARTGRFVLMAGLGASALGLIFGVAAPSVLAAIFVVAGLGAAIRRLVGSLTHNLWLQPFLAAWVAGLLGGWFQQVSADPHRQFVALAACMILVPGAHILNASLDLARGRLGLGASRLVYCATTLLVVCAGLLLGLSLSGGAMTLATTAVQTPLGLDILAAGVAVAAFGAFFSLPWHLLAAPVLVGMLCHGCRWLLLEMGNGVVVATLGACLIAGAIMTVLARRLKLPFAALAFASVVSMMPGILVFKLAANLVDIYSAGPAATLAMLVAVIGNGTGALMVVLAMALGLVVPKVLIERWLWPGS